MQIVEESPRRHHTEASAVPTLHLRPSSVQSRLVYNVNLRWRNMVICRRGDWLRMHGYHRVGQEFVVASGGASCTVGHRSHRRGGNMVVGSPLLNGVRGIGV